MEIWVRKIIFPNRPVVPVAIYTQIADHMCTQHPTNTNVICFAKPKKWSVQNHGNIWNCSAQKAQTTAGASQAGPHCILRRACTWAADEIWPCVCPKNLLCNQKPLCYTPLRADRKPRSRQDDAGFSGASFFLFSLHLTDSTLIINRHIPVEGKQSAAVFQECDRTAALSCSVKQWVSFFHHETLSFPAYLAAQNAWE